MLRKLEKADVRSVTYLDVLKTKPGFWDRYAFRIRIRLPESLLRTPVKEFMLAHELEHAIQDATVYKNIPDAIYQRVEGFEFGRERVFF